MLQIEPCAGRGGAEKRKGRKGLLIVDLMGAGGGGVQLLFELLLNLPGLLGERSLLHLPDLLLHGVGGGRGGGGSRNGREPGRAAQGGFGQAADDEQGEHDAEQAEGSFHERGFLLLLKNAAN